MRKVDLVARMVAATDLPKHTAEKAIEAVLAAISASLPQGEAVTLRGLGTFAVRTKRARQAATPRPERPRPFCPGGSSCLRPARSSSRPWRAPRRAAQQLRKRRLAHAMLAGQPHRRGKSVFAIHA
jgi:DNA-binding protein HU-beta